MAFVRDVVYRNEINLIHDHGPVMKLGNASAEISDISTSGRGSLFAESGFVCDSSGYSWMVCC